MSRVRHLSTLHGINFPSFSDEHAKEELKAKTEEKPTTEEKPDAQSKETGNDDTVMQTENRPALEQEAKPKKASIFVEIQPNDKQLCVKAVPEAITRQDLMDVSATSPYRSACADDRCRSCLFRCAQHSKASIPSS